MPEDLSVVDAVPTVPLRRWDLGGHRPVLALHCSLAHAGAWAALADNLTGVSMTAFDQVGHGKAEDWDGQSNLHDLATSTAIDLAERLGGGAPIDLFGHSFGGTVALRVAMARPDLVRSLVLVEPVIFAAAQQAGHPEYAPFRAAHLEFASVLAKGRREDAAALFHAQWGTGEHLSDLPERQRNYITERIHHIAAQNPFLLDDSTGLLREGGLESVKVPVLLVEGGESPPIIDAVQSALAARLPIAKRLIVPGAGHMVSITHAAEVGRVVQDHLAAS